jgi:anti-anti-sigma factor
MPITMKRFSGECHVNITSEKQNGVSVVTVSGRMDGIGAPDVEAHCQKLIADGDRLQLLDLTAVDYISSAGLRSLLVVAKQIKAAEGNLVLASLTPMVRNVMEMSGFDKILSIAANRDDAIALLNL